MTGEHEDRVTELVAEVLDSFEKLEILLMLARATAATPLAQLIDAVPVERADAIAELDALVGHGVVAAEPAGYTLVLDGAWIDHVRALVALHRTDRMRVASLMAKASVERIRAHAARSLVDGRLARSGGKSGGKVDREG